MGDTYTKIIPQNVSSEEVNNVAGKVIEYLTNRRIIKTTKTDCTLGEPGYPPGDNYEQVLQDDNGFRELTTNGLELTIGGRNVFWTNEIDAIKCPNCMTDIITLDWGQAIDEWTNDTGNDKIQCPDCGNAHSIVDFNFEPAWAFGQLGLTFWNWPAFKDEFLEDIQAAMGKKVKVIYGKL
jgi:hypothetical protein